MARVDVEDSTDGIPKAFQIKGYDNIHMKNGLMYNHQRKNVDCCKDMICKRSFKK